MSTWNEGYVQGLEDARLDILIGRVSSYAIVGFETDPPYFRGHHAGYVEGLVVHTRTLVPRLEKREPYDGVIVGLRDEVRV